MFVLRFSSHEIITEIYHIHGTNPQRIHRIFIAWPAESTAEAVAHCHLAFVHGSLFDSHTFDGHRHRARQTVSAGGKRRLPRFASGWHFRYGTQFYVSTAERTKLEHNFDLQNDR